MIFVSLLITIFCYLLFPLAYVRINGKVPAKKGKKIALWNSVVWEIVFTVPEIALFGSSAADGFMFAQGFLFYFISKKILIDPYGSATPKMQSGSSRPDGEEGDPEDSEDSEEETEGSKVYIPPEDKE